jgi:hypothetical protein
MVDGSARMINDFIQSGITTAIGASITEAQSTEDQFLAWQRLNVARDGYPVGATE